MTYKDIITTIVIADLKSKNQIFLLEQELLDGIVDSLLFSLNLQNQAERNFNDSNDKQQETYIKNIVNDFLKRWIKLNRLQKKDNALLKLILENVKSKPTRTPEKINTTTEFTPKSKDINYLIQFCIDSWLSLRKYKLRINERRLITRLLLDQSIGEDFSIEIWQQITHLFFDRYSNLKNQEKDDEALKKLLTDIIASTKRINTSPLLTLPQMLLEENILPFLTPPELVHLGLSSHQIYSRMITTRQMLNKLWAQYSDHFFSQTAKNSNNAKAEFLSNLENLVKDMPKKDQQTYIKLFFPIYLGDIAELSRVLRNHNITGADFWFIQDSQGKYLFQYINDQPMRDRLFKDMEIQFGANKKPTFKQIGSFYENMQSLMFWFFQCNQSLKRIQFIQNKYFCSFYEIVYLACRFNRLDVLQAYFNDIIPDTETIRDLLTYKDKYSQNAILSTIRGDHSDILAFLITKDMDLNAPTMSTIFQTIKSGAETRIEGYEPQHLAAHYSADCLKLLIAAGVDLTRRTACRMRYTSLILACINGNLEAVKLILAARPELLLETDALGQTPLMWACSKEHLGIVKYLIEQISQLPRQAHIDAINHIASNGRVALHYAADNGCTEVMKLLLNDRADPLHAQSPKTNFYPIHIACQKGNLASVKLLLQSNFQKQLNCTDNLHQTPLIWAASKGHANIVAYLLLQGADPTLHSIPVGGNGPSTALGYARKNNHHNVIEIFEIYNNNKLSWEEKNQILHSYCDPTSTEIVDDSTAEQVTATQQPTLSQNLQEACQLPDGLTLVDSADDGKGNCYYYAIAEYLGQDANVLREAIANHIEEEQTYYEPFRIEQEIPFSSYIAHIRQSEWADQLVIRATVKTYQRPVVIFHPNTAPIIHEEGCSSEAPPIFAIFDGVNHYYIAKLNNNASPTEIFNQLKQQQAEAKKQAANQAANLVRHSAILTTPPPAQRQNDTQISGENTAELGSTRLKK